MLNPEGRGQESHPCRLPPHITFYSINLLRRGLVLVVGAPHLLRQWTAFGCTLRATCQGIKSWPAILQNSCRISTFTPVPDIPERVSSNQNSESGVIVGGDKAPEARHYDHCNLMKGVFL